MFTEEEFGINMQGSEHIGSSVDLWQNLENYEMTRGSLRPGKKVSPLFRSVEEYLGMKIFPINPTPYA